MTLIVEDGTVVAGAESYVTVLEFKSYCDKRGISYATMTDPQIEQAARKAFDYLLWKYRLLWKGYRKDATQVADWPRSFVYLEPFVHGAVGTYPFLVDENTIPKEVKNAQIELMVRAGSQDLMPDLERGQLKVTVGPVSIEYDKFSDEQVRFKAVDSLLRPYLRVSDSISTKVNRA